jgi:glycine cleavage system aminomethyltransferase T
VGVEIDGQHLVGNDRFWEVLCDEDVIGHVTRCTWSPRLERNIGLVNVPVENSTAGSRLTIQAPDGRRDAVVVPVPWVQSETRIPADL